MGFNPEWRPCPKAQYHLPAIFYWGTPVVLITTENPDLSFNIAPMSSAWWLGNRCMLGLGAISQTTINLLRTSSAFSTSLQMTWPVLLMLWARTTGSEEILTAKPDEGYKYSRG